MRLLLGDKGSSLCRSRWLSRYAPIVEWKSACMSLCTRLSLAPQAISRFTYFTRVMILVNSGELRRPLRNFDKNTLLSQLPFGTTCSPRFHDSTEVTTYMLGS